MTTDQPSDNSVSSETDQDSCFVLMPFGHPVGTYYELIYSKAIKAAGLRPVRVDGIYGPNFIIGDIWREIRSAAVLLADLTTRNPNVLYELGLGHASAKPVVMVSATIDDVPFDIQGWRVILYDITEPYWGEKLAGAVTESIKRALAAPQEWIFPTFLTPSEDASPVQVSDLEKRLLVLESQMGSFDAAIRRRTAFFAHGQPTGLDSALGDMPVAIPIQEIESLAEWARGRELGLSESARLLSYAFGLPTDLALEFAAGISRRSSQVPKEEGPPNS